MFLIRAITLSLFSLSLIVSAANAKTGCRPPLPPVIPDAKTATKDQVLSALKAIKNDFQPAIKNFQNCIATEKTAIGDVATEEQMNDWNQLFDAAYALETQVATKMNETIRAYKARAAAAKAEKK